MKAELGPAWAEYRIVLAIDSKEISMKKLLTPVALLLIAVLCTGCLYSNVKVPLDSNLDRTQMGDKEGESRFYSILWLFSWGDAGTAAAAEEGEITTLNHMDMEILSVLFGLYYRQKTIVYGD